MNSDSYARFDASGAAPVICLERHFAVQPTDLWQALTDSRILAQWFPADLQGPRRTGGAIRIVSWSDRFPPVEGRITAYEPPTVLEYTWGGERLRWEISPQGRGCILVFRNVLDAAAEVIGPAAIAAAWHACFDVLEFVLRGETVPFDAETRTSELLAWYAREMPAMHRRQ